MDDLALYEEIVRIKKERLPAVLATVIDSRGSSPRKAGAKMLIYADGTTNGTVGGGAIEAETVAAAREVVRDRASRTLAFDLTEAQNSVCGGEMTIYLEPLVTAPHCLIIGDGHVGKAVSRVAEQAGFLVSLLGKEDDLQPVLRRVDHHTYVLVATSDHQQDFLAVKEVLTTPARHIAVLGSRRKRTAMEQFLKEHHFTPEAINRIISPAGLDIHAETPEEIAVSVVAQMIQVRRTNADKNRSTLACRRSVAAHGHQQAIAAAG
ncbi:MAG TPA: XdhC family protein [Desulfurivibrionaceae bacterium]|nr:XdhC family protein [Desulfurivibrionaceae bacterium]